MLVPVNQLLPPIFWRNTVLTCTTDRCCGFWQKVCQYCQFSHCWQEVFERIVTAMELLVIFGPALVAGLIATYQNRSSLGAPHGVGFEPDSGRAQLELELVNRRDVLGHG